MPLVTLRTVDAGGKETKLTEYICDWPGCPNVAEHVLGVLIGLRAFAAVCREHAAVLAARQQSR
jgi:hypothetical protein